MCSFEGLLSFAEASKKWGLKDSTLRKAVQNGKIVENVDCKKFGSVWVIKETVMYREYGNPEEEQK